MRTFLNMLIVTFLTMIVLSSCEKDENMEVTNNLDGRWEIESISILENNEWKTVSNQDTDLGFLVFNACQDRNEKCTGYRETSNGDEVEFEFSVSGADKKRNPTTVNMAFYPNNDSTVQWQGVYDIVALSSQLTLERREDDLIIRAKRI